MKTVARYRHEDGRTVDLCEDGGKRYALWLIYPERDQIEGELSRDGAQKKLEDLGFIGADQGFASPCPRCREPCTMSVETGLYFCADCQNAY